MLSFDAALDPLSVDSSSVIVGDVDGRRLEAEVGVEAGQLVIRPVATPELVAQPPAALQVRLAGLPSPHALRTAGGRALGRGQTLRVPLRPALQDEGPAPPRLIEPAEAVVDVPSDGRVVLVFDGVLDPSTVTPGDCALQPLAGGLVLTGAPVLPGVGWRCVGRRFELTLRLPRASGALQLSLRRSGLRGVDGRVPEPARELELRSP
ncbi:MAG TPA: hypothetical protein VFY71_01775 [Planctomycetota bacterium]|nr:hypothetical protein [Planctomycetota bacterium]